MNTISRNLFILFFMILLPLIVNSQENNELITRIKAQLLFYRTRNAIQTLAIQTDKSLYRPGEAIWIKGYVADALSRKPSMKSGELIVQLVDYKGNVINSAIFALKNGMAAGSISITTNPGSGMYSLVARTSELKNGSLDQTGWKHIYIARPENLSIVPKIEYSGTVFSPESKGTAILKLSDYSGKSLSGEKFSYKIMSGSKEILSGKGKTTQNGSGEISFTTPAANHFKALTIDADIPAGKERINLISHIPLASENIDVSLFPEGGKLVPGIPQRVVFEAKDQFGYPVDVSGDIVNDQGEILAKTTSIQKGMGAFNTIIPDHSGCKFRITNDPGKGQVIALPAADTSRICISVIKSDKQNISLLLARSPRTKHSKFLALALDNGEINWASEFELGQSGTIKLPLDNFESEIAAVAIFNSNGTLAGERLIYTGKDNQINVSISPDKSSYSIGAEGNIKVKLKRPDGTPLKGTISASISDSSASPLKEAVLIGLNFGFEKPMEFDGPLDQVNKTILDFNLIANHLKGVDWDKITAIDPVNPKTMISSDTGSPGGTADSGDKVNNNSNGKVIDIHNNHEMINEWKFLEAYQHSGYFNENPDFLKAAPSESKKSEDYRDKVPYWKKYLEGSGTVIDAVKMIKPFETINGMIVFRGANSLNFQDGALIVVDDQKMGSDASLLSQMDPKIVEDIKVLLDPNEIARYTGFNSVGVIVITTKRGGPTVKNVPAEDISQKDKSNTLFMPHPIGNKKYNLLTTLRWIPDLSTDENGETTIKFTTGNIKSTFTIKIAGYTDKGEWFEKEGEIAVK